MNEGTQIVAEQVAERVKQIDTLKHKKLILAEAFAILQELGEEKLCTAFLEAGKRIGSKLKS